MAEHHQLAQTGQPLTHRAYCTRVAAISLATRTLPITWVQVKHRGAVLCGRIAECSEFASGEFFKVETDIGPIWAKSTNTRLCSGDGRCSCEVQS